MLFVSMQRGADFRHTPLGSPQATLIYGKSAPFRAVPIISVAHSSLVAIERLSSNMSLHSFRIAVAKLQNIFRKA